MTERIKCPCCDDGTIYIEDREEYSGEEDSNYVIQCDSCRWNLGCVFGQFDIASLVYDSLRHFDQYDTIGSLVAQIKQYEMERGANG